MKINFEADLVRSQLFSGVHSVWIAFVSAVILIAMSGCSQLMGGLRPDLNDEYSYEKQPTLGGRFTEGGFLDEENGRSPSSEDIAHNERKSTASGRMGGQGTWIGAAEEDRNALRRPASDEDDQHRLAERPVMQKKYKSGNRASREDFVDDSRDDGSLWTSEGQTNYFMTKNQIKSQGDLVTIIVDEDFLKDVASEIKRTMTPDEREVQMDLAQERARRVAMGLPEKDDPAAKNDQVANSQSAANRAPGSEGEVNVPAVSWAQVDLLKSMELKVGDAVMTEVLERYPNGNYKLRGVKRVRMNGQTKMVSVLAIAKNSDITADETIPAGKLYEYRIESVR